MKWDMYMEAAKNTIKWQNLYQALSSQLVCVQAIGIKSQLHQSSQGLWIRERTEAQLVIKNE